MVKKNIKSLIEKEETHLNNLLEKEDLNSFKEMRDELRDTWNKKQIFRTEVEARFSVLQDNNYPSKAAKYWQAVKEQSVFFENLIGLSFDYRRNNVEIKKLQNKIDSEKDDLEKELLQIDLDQKIYGKASMEQTAKDRMREIKMWSKLKKEFNDGSFDTTNVAQHQLDSYHKIYQLKAKTITQGTSQAEVHNILGQLNTIERVKTNKEITFDKKYESMLEHDNEKELTFGKKNT